jgi:hypothetical protein
MTGVRQPRDDAPLVFKATIIHWRGPAPYFFAPIPPEQAAALRLIAKAVSYGWGVIPVEATISGVAFTTSLIPKGDTYLLPVKDAVRRKTGITAGDTVSIEMTVRPPKHAT